MLLEVVNLTVLYVVSLQAQALANSFGYEDYIEQRKKEKLEAECMSRITVSSLHHLSLQFVYFV